MPEPNATTSKVPLGRAYEILPDGSTFGGYTIIRCLAYDMLGSLYLAQNGQTGSRETLFVFPSLVTQDKAFADRFLEQSKALCELKHPNIVNFNRAQIIQNAYCLVGEAFEGLTLPDHLMLLTGSTLSVSESGQAPNLPPSQVTPILELALTGLIHAHGKRVLHLNLNPTKILRSAYGEVKIYGLHLLAILGQELFEMLVSAGIPPLKLDPNRSFISTTDILSPEARLRKTLDTRSDLYAIGIDTHWLLTGRKPTSPYKTPSQLIPAIETGWDAFIIRCLQRNPNERVPSANAALTDLRNLAQLKALPQAGPLELLLAPETAAERHAAGKGIFGFFKSKSSKTSAKGKPPLRRPLRLALLGLLGAVVIGFGAYMSIFLIEDEDQSGSPQHISVARTRDGQTPRLRLSITPRNASVTIHPGDQFFTVTDGELPLNLSSGSYTLQIESPQHTTQRIRYTVQRQNDRFYVKLEPAWAQVDFSTAPGATLRAIPANGNPINLGVAPENGVLHVAQGLGDGTYSFEATKEAYEPATLQGQKLELAKSYRFDIKPVAKPTTLTLVSEPPGATVKIGDRVLGKTPFTTSNIPVDSDVTLTLEHDGYHPVVRTIRTQPGATEQIDLGSLAAKTGELALDFTLAGRTASPEEMRDAKIIINGKVYPATVHHFPNVTEAGYAVHIEHPDYFPFDKTVAVTEGNATAVAGDLQPRPAHLFIQPTPQTPINVFLDGKPLAAQGDGAYPIPAGHPEQVRVEAKDFSSAVQEFKLDPNQSKSWQISLAVLPGPVENKSYTVPYLDIAMAWIPPGTCDIGSSASEPEHKPSEGPPTTVVVPKGFWAGIDEVTQAQYQAVMGDNPSQFAKGAKDAGNYPIESVSWLKAVEFTRRVNDREKAAGRVPTGYEYRLPTRVEWEYFARAGTNTAFSFGDKADKSDGNFRGSYPLGSGSGVISSDSHYGTMPVGSFKPNPFGLYDVHGNVSEWVLDAYKSRLPGGNVIAPSLQPSDDTSRREYRGGGWNDYAVDARSAARDLGQGARPDVVSNSTGLRLVLAPVIQPQNP